MNTCPFCHVSSQVEAWVETEVYCEDCGEHLGARCPECGEVVDLTFNDDVVLP